MLAVSEKESSYFGSAAWLIVQKSQVVYSHFINLVKGFWMVNHMQPHRKSKCS